MTPGSDHRRGRHVVAALHVHLVFVTKYRRAALDDAILTRCEQIMRKVRAGFSAELAEFNGQDNQHSIHGHFWSPSYLVATCGGAPLSAIRQYVEQQNRPG